jgi:L-ascorbate metabolism protein UlaG (beta-lactamase superfamily)
MKDRAGVDVAFIPVNQPYTMTPAQASAAARMIKPKILYPYHFGDTRIEELKDLLKDQPGIEVRIRKSEHLAPLALIPGAAAERFSG